MLGSAAHLEFFQMCFSFRRVLGVLSNLGNAPLLAYQALEFRTAIIVCDYKNHFFKFTGQERLRLLS